MRKLAASLLGLGLLVSGGLWAQQASAPANPAVLDSGKKEDSGKQESQSEPATTLKVDVKLVNVFVTVTDAHGSPVGGLTKENFVLSEDGHEQKISVFDKESALPLSIALAVDTSLSTRHDLPLEQASAKRFAHAILRPVDALSVYGFSETVQEATHGFTPDLKRIDEGIDHIRVGAATALFDAIYLVSRALDPRKGRKVIVLITDGGDTISKVDYKEAVRAARRSRGDRLFDHHRANRKQRWTRDWRRARAHPALGRHGRQVLLRDVDGATRRCIPARSATNCGRNICWPTIHRSELRFRISAASM